jgi:hypothetical protein
MFGVRVMVPWHREDDARHVLDGLSLENDQADAEEIP